MFLFYFWTNLGPIQVELIVKHIIRPQCCKSWILEDLTNIVIFGLTITLLKDTRNLLLNPLSDLFNKIYSTGLIPEQWKVSKIIPIFKKGNKNEIENYRPIANLCSASKVFEKLILKQIHYLEATNKLDLTGKQQHGFKKKKSTATAGALLQSIISRAADDNKWFSLDKQYFWLKSMSSSRIRP